MNKALKYAGIATVAAGLLYAAAFSAKRLMDGLTYKVVGFGVPSISNAVLTLPVIIRFNNSAPVNVPVDRLSITLSYLRGNTFIPSANVDQSNVILKPGTQDITVTPQLNIASLFSNILDTLKTYISNNALSIKADVLITIKGISYTDSFFKDVKI